MDVNGYALILWNRLMHWDDCVEHNLMCKRLKKFVHWRYIHRNSMIEWTFRIDWNWWFWIDSSYIMLQMCWMLSTTVLELALNLAIRLDCYLLILENMNNCFLSFVYAIDVKSNIWRQIVFSFIQFFSLFSSFIILWILCANYLIQFRVTHFNLTHGIENNTLSDILNW